MSDREGELAVLMRAAIAGDGAAYGRLLRQITPILRGIVRARARALPPDQHEDLVQDVLMAIHSKRHTWRSDAPLLPWLYAIARYKVIDAHRRTGARVFLPIDDLADDLPDPDAGDALAARDLGVLMAGLDPRAAEIVQRAGVEGQDMASIAQRLGMREGAVRVALHRAMKRLAVLAKGGADDHDR